MNIIAKNQNLSNNQKQRFFYEKLRNFKNHRNFSHLQNTDIYEVFKKKYLPDIKGTFLEGGSFLKEYLLVGFDTEFYFEDKYLKFVSYQFWVFNDDKGYLFVNEKGNKLSLKDVLLFLNEIYKNKKIIFVSHFGVVDYLKFEDYEEFVKSLKLNMKTLFGKLNYEFYDINRNKKEFNLYFKDSMLLGGGGSLKNLGKVIGIEKIDIGKNIERMDVFYRDNFDEFVAYSMNDSIIAVNFYIYFVKVLENVLGLTFEEILRINTASSVGEVFFKKVLEEKGMEVKEFTGIKTIEKVYWNSKLNKLMKFVKQDFDDEMKLWEKGYYGGRNETYLYGVYRENWFDYDIKNAYPLAMLSIQDVDWNFRIMINNKNLNELEFNDIGFIYLDFEFNEDVLFPMFPVRTDHGLIFPRTGRTVVSIPEFLTALNNKMLKDFNILDGVRFKRKEELTIPNFIKLVIKERSKYEKGSLENTIWKLIGNSFYGKTAQGLTNKKSLNLKGTIEKGEKVYKQVGKSGITNHFIAGYITGTVRALVSEYLNYFDKENIRVVNITTDGFMIDTKLEDEELKGVGYLTSKFSKIREKWLNDKEILELKHYSEEDSLNVVIKTRGYWMEKGKVLIARAGIQTKGMNEKETYLYLTKNFLDANYNSIYIQKSLKNIGDVLIGNVEDIISFEREVGMNFDYDFKRKPFKFKNEDIEFEKKSYVKLKIEKTIPFENVEEFLEWKKAYEKFKKYKTNINKITNEEDLKNFIEYIKIEKFKDTQVKSLEQVILTKIIFVLLLKGYRIVEIAKLLNIKQSMVKKRKYSKTFETIEKKGIKKISEKEYKEVFEKWINENIKDRKIKILIKNELVEKEVKIERSYFELLD